MKPNWFAVIGLALTVLAAPIYAEQPAKPEPTPAEARNSLKTMRKQALDELYKLQPEAKKQIRAAAGYAVFSTQGVQLLLVGGGNGQGIARDNLNGRDTYMQMASAGVGFGVGIKDIRYIFVFRTREAMKSFVDKGWQFGGEAQIGAKTEGSGGVATGGTQVEENIQVYQLEKGSVIAQVVLQGLKFWKDDKLNP